VQVIELSPMEDECAVCGKWVVGVQYGIAMYEGCVVPDDSDLPWAGMGKPGAPYGNTLTGMTMEACERLANAQAQFREERA